MKYEPGKNNAAKKAMSDRTTTEEKNVYERIVS
jgi:hypothetical protein